MVKDREPRDPEDSGFIVDMIRRTVERSVNAVIHSDEERRRFMSSLVPRDFINNLSSAVDSTKRDAVQMIGREMQQFLENLNVGEELKKILTSVSFEIATTVRFVPNEEGDLRPEVRRTQKPIVKSTAAAKAKKARKAKGKSAATKTAAARSAQAESLRASVPRARGRVQRVVDAIGETAEMIVGGRDPEDDGP